MAWLDDAGLRMVAGVRDYRGSIAGEEACEIQLMSSAEIAAALASGDVHFGITGEDLIRENIPQLDKTVVLLQPLAFGFADVVVAVPRAWIDVANMADLDDVCTAFHARHHRRLRVATKYLGLTRNFFAAFKTSALTFVSLRTINPENSGIISITFAGASFSWTETSRSPFADSASIPRCEIASATRTLGGVTPKV